MDATTETILFATLYMLTKHVIADYVLQNGYMVCNKGCYGHPGGMLHAGTHALLSLPVFYFLPPPTALMGASVLGAEFFVHYHIDWLKDKVTKWAGWQTTDRAFWIAFGVDQYLHTLTYLAIVWYLAVRM